MLSEASTYMYLHVHVIMPPPPFEKGGAYCLAHVGRYVDMSVSLNLVQLITQECFAQEASNLVGR